jgi:hypothetical protein
MCFSRSEILTYRLPIVPIRKAEAAYVKSGCRSAEENSDLSP